MALDPELQQALGGSTAVTPTKKKKPEEELGYFEGFGKSILWSPLSLFGVEPPQNVSTWEGQNPVSAFGAGMIGLPIPYIGYLKAASKSTKLAGAIDKVADAEKLAASPFKAGVAREAVRFAPFEIGRVGAAAFGGEELAETLGTEYRGTGDVAASAVLDLGLAGLVGGGFEALKAAGTRSLRDKYELPGVDVSKPKQMQLRQLEENLAKGVVADVDAANAGRERLSWQIRREKPKDGKYVLDLEEGFSTKAVNRLFKEKDSEGLLRTRIQQTLGGKFETRESVEEVFQRAGLGKNPEAYMQHPRYVEGKNPGTARLLNSILGRQLKPLDSEKGWFYSFDKGSNLYVMAKRVPEVGKELTSGKGSNSWLLFKTDTPGHFVPEHKAFLETAERRAKMFDADKPKLTPLGEGADVYDSALNFYQNVPAIDTRGLDPRRGGAAKLAGTIADKTGISKFAPEGTAAAEGALNLVKTYLTPGMFAFDHPVAQKAFNMARHALDTAEAAAERLFLGAKALSEKRGSLFKEVARGALPEGKDNLQALIRAASKDKDQWQAVWRAITSNTPVEEAIKKFGLDGPGLDLLKALEKVDAWQSQGMSKTMAAIGGPEFKPLPNHYMVSRTWEGDWRVPIYEGNHLIGMASGTTKGVAQSRAQALFDSAKADGIALRVGKPNLSGELEQDLRYLAKIDPQRMNLFGKIQEQAFLKGGAPARATDVRTGVGGYVGHQKPWTPEQFEKLVLKQLRDYQRFQAKASIEHMLDDDFVRLQRENPQIAEQLKHRVNSMYGQQGKFSEEVNKFTDKALAPVLGKNSASKITAATNKWLFRWTMGFANAGFNIANALTFVQTAYPQLAFLTTTAPSRAARYYTYWPIMGEKSVKPLGMLDMMKLTKRSYEMMARPDDLLWKHFGRAAQDGVWDPRFIEEFVGQKAQKIASLKEILKGDQPYSRWFEAAADALPSFSEKFARGHTFTLGHAFFKDVMGVQDDEMLYQLTKQFVEKTQFLYGVGDRARITTGPLGGAFGLFKNWVMHYIGWMGAYADEGFLKGNWKPLLWQMGSTSALGGVAAVPLFGAADTMSKWMSDKSIMQHTYDMYGGSTVADNVFYGLPANLGFSIQNQVAAPFADPGSDAARLFSLAYLDRGKYLGQALGASMDSIGATGQNPVRDPHVRDLFMRALAPKTLYRVNQVWQDATMRSLTTGNAVTSLTPVERVMYGLGVNPLWAEKSFRVADALWKDQEKMKAAVAAAGEAWAHGIETGDQRLLQQVILRAVYSGLDVSSVIKSGQTRVDNHQQEQIDRQFSPRAVLEYRNVRERREVE